MKSTRTGTDVAFFPTIDGDANLAVVMVMKSASFDGDTNDDPCR